MPALGADERVYSTATVLASRRGGSGDAFIGTDGHVKILDFGLARSVVSVAAATNSPTELRTDPGTIMGTIGYMAPEQVKGATVDHRADLFSFGCVLYEMITGRRAFERATPAETMTAILREDLPPAPPDVAALPPALDQIVRHCLEKQPHERFQSAHDLTFALRAIAGSSSGLVATGVQKPTRRHADVWRWLAVTGVVAICTGATAWWLARRTAPSPGGSDLGYGEPQVDLAASRLVGKDDATFAVSPDGNLIAYVNDAHSEIRLHDLQSGTSRTLVNEGEVGEPVFSPDGRFLAYVSGLRIEALRLSDRSRHRLIDGGTAPRYLPTGHLLYERAGQLVAVPFDPERLAVSGVPVTVAEGVANFTPAGIVDPPVVAPGRAP